MTTLHVSVSCHDRTGLVAAITGCLFDLGANLGDTTFAVLGTGAEFTALVDVPGGLDAVEVRRALAARPELADAEITVERYAAPAGDGAMGRVSHVITVSGGDQPGLIARITETFVQFGASIVHLEAGPEPGAGPQGRYTTRFSVAIPPQSAEACLATVANTAGAMNLACRWEEVEKQDEK